MALGASSRSVSGLIVTQALARVAAGGGGGVALSLAVTRLLIPFLFGVSPGDPFTYAVIIGLLGE